MRKQVKVEKLDAGRRKMGTVLNIERVRGEVVQRQTREWWRWEA